jgi:hypothetical protein
MPFPPMRRQKADDLLLGLSVHPAAENSPTRENQSMWLSVGVEDSELQVAVEWRARYRLPIHPLKCWDLFGRLDPDQRYQAGANFSSR